MKPKKEKKAPCKHEGLHFERGGLHVVCSDCGDMWRAVIKPHGIVLNIAARSQGLNRQDKRRNPAKP